jgi:hypothetical protein
MQGRQRAELEKLQVFGLHSEQHQFGIENELGKRKGIGKDADVFY